MKVPRKIHVVWLNKSDAKVKVTDETGLKPEYKENYYKWRDLNPDFEIKFWNDEKVDQLLRDVGRGWLDHFKAAVNIAEKADIARYAILQAEGGYYVDTDTIPYKPLTVLEEKYKDTKEEVIMGSQRDMLGWMMLSNSFIISEKNARFWKVMEEYIRKKWENRNSIDTMVPMMDVVDRTGPGAINKLRKKNRHLIRHVETGVKNGTCNVCEIMKKTCDLSNAVYTHTGNSDWEWWWCEHGGGIYYATLIFLLLVGLTMIFQGVYYNRRWPANLGERWINLAMLFALAGIAVAMILPMAIVRDDFDNYWGAMLSMRLNETSDLITLISLVVFCLAMVVWVRSRMRGNLVVMGLLLLAAQQFLIMKVTWDEALLHFLNTLLLTAVVVYATVVTPVWIPLWVYVVFLGPLFVTMVYNKTKWGVIEREVHVSDFEWYSYYVSQLLPPTGLILWFIYVNHQLG